MRRLRVIFILFLLLAGILIWRLMDMAVFILPDPWLYSALFGLFVLCFLLWPVKIWNPKIKLRWIFLAALTLAGLSRLTRPLSHMATTYPEHSHCGPTTFTGLFYPVRSLLPASGQDDLEARNQLCWVRKMITKVPDQFDSEADLNFYLTLIEKKLFKPEHKYRVTLPLVAVLYMKTYSAWGQSLGAEKVYASLHFWMDHYTEEISTRRYSNWNWPYSAYIQFEYGLVERNWEDLIESSSLEQ